MFALYIHQCAAVQFSGGVYHKRKCKTALLTTEILEIGPGGI